VVRERNAEADGEGAAVMVKAFPAATCFACWLVGLCEYCRGLAHRCVVGLGEGIIEGVAALCSKLKVGRLAMRPESDSLVEEADSLLLGRGMKLMVCERGNGLGVAFGSWLPSSLVCLPGSGVLRSVDEASSETELLTEDRRWSDSRGALGTVMGSTVVNGGAVVGPSGVTLRCVSGLEIKDKP
jgi:hypothetical protein